MSSIASQLNNTVGSTTTPAASKKSTALLDNDQILKLFMTQLKYQDPTAPMKAAEMAESISRLSAVEQSVKTNKYLDDISNTLQNSNSQLGNPVSYIDKNIDFNSSQFALTNKIGGFSYVLDSTNPQSKVTIAIKDSTGKVVVNTPGTSKAGVNNIKWDGTDNDGNQLKDGLYTVVVSYPDPKTANLPPKDQKSIELPTYTNGKVTEADFTGDEPALKVGGIMIPLTAIRKLYGTGV